MMVTLRFDDGTSRDFPFGVTGKELVEAVPVVLVTDPIAVKVNGCLLDLQTKITENAFIEFVPRDSEDGLYLIRHSCAHVLAEAVQALYPDIKLSIGPVIGDGFYYDFHCGSSVLSVDTLPVIEAKMHEIVERDKSFVMKVFAREEVERVFFDKDEFFKVQIVKEIPVSEEIKIYCQGSWFDLCRGPHVVSSGQIGHHFKLLKVAGAYWRGDASQPMLSRVYGTAWTTANELNAYLDRLQEAEKRDHRKLGTDLSLFHFQEEGPGVVFWHPKGWTLFQLIISYLRRRFTKDYVEVNAPQVLHSSLWKASGHIDWYKEYMFGVSSLEDELKAALVLKPMNCPGHIQIFKQGLKSYRDLPFRISEFGVVHRREPSGGMHGLMRVRGFTQDDAHVFCTEAQLFDECLRINDLVLSVYRDFGFDEIKLKLSTRPEKRIGSDELWDRAERVLLDVSKQIVLSDSNLKLRIQPNDGAFYGPKFEYTLTDAIGREWQCGTIQVDFNLLSRFSAFYVDTDGSRREPIMLHRAVCGSIERFIGILIEHYAGNLPLWLAPVQLLVANITSDVSCYAKEVADRFTTAGLRAETDLRNEKINYKVREHSAAKIPIILVVGKREQNEKSVSVRRFGSKETASMLLDDAIKLISCEAAPPDLLK